LSRPPDLKYTKIPLNALSRTQKNIEKNVMGYIYR